MYVSRRHSARATTSSSIEAVERKRKRTALKKIARERWRSNLLAEQVVIDMVEQLPLGVRAIIVDYFVTVDRSARYQPIIIPGSASKDLRDASTQHLPIVVCPALQQELIPPAPKPYIRPGLLGVRWKTAKGYSYSKPLRHHEKLALVTRRVIRRSCLSIYP